MADVHQLIKKILSDPKIATNSNFASKVYSDEPILFTAPQMEAFTPPKIREMRQLARGGGAEAKVFYDQGMFMASFEDTYEYRGEFVQYFPTYQSMTDSQLRGYFSWRTKVRNGTVEKTSLSFVFVYIYELLNGIGVSDPKEGFHTLKRFWTAYRALDSRVDSYAALWLKDYAIYHNLDKSLLEGLPDIGFDDAVSVLLDYDKHGVKEVFEALNSLSSYDLADSKFFKQHPEDVMHVVNRVFRTVSAYYNRNPKKNAREKLFGRLCANAYGMFRAAVFYPRGPRETRTYELGPFHKYICTNGDWTCERFVWYGNNNKQIGALLKTVDYLMRQAYGYKSTLQPGKTNKTLRTKIEKEIAQYEQDKRDNALPVIEIDVTRLHGIRTAALATQCRLLVDAPEPDPEPEPEPEAKTEEHIAAPSLTDAERRYLRHLLYDEPFDPRGLMPSVLTDGINEKLYDALGDTAIADDAVLEDYREELKGMFPQ